MIDDYKLNKTVAKSGQALDYIHQMQLPLKEDRWFESQVRIIEDKLLELREGEKH